MKNGFKRATASPWTGAAIAIAFAFSTVSWAAPGTGSSGDPTPYATPNVNAPMDTTDTNQSAAQQAAPCPVSDTAEKSDKKDKSDKDKKDKDNKKSEQSIDDVEPGTSAVIARAKSIALRHPSSLRAAGGGQPPACCARRSSSSVPARGLRPWRDRRPLTPDPGSDRSSPLCGLSVSAFLNLSPGSRKNLRLCNAGTTRNSALSARLVDAVASCFARLDLDASRRRNAGARRAEAIGCIR